PAPGGTMRTWQDIFAEKIADVHLTEPWMLQEDDTLQVHVLKPGWKEFVHWSPPCPGRFRCSQCLHEWSSAKVHILFHMCRRQGHGTVRMRAFRQACRRCPDPQLEEAEFNYETVEKLLHNLVLKILQYFYHVSVQPSDLLEVVVDAPVAGPHDSNRCEGCQLGICSKLRPPQEMHLRFLIFPKGGTSGCSPAFAVYSSICPGPMYLWMSLVSLGVQRLLCPPKISRC
uniref:3CxxC-type domain-containing protein n=1 Tax=Calidris pygmaea TaxID=425635 RepID=A0A8C3KTE2_9CHAR